MKKLLAPVFLLALLIVSTTGCSNASRIISTGLQIELTGITRAADGTVSASWQVANSNVVSYLLSRTSHKIYLNGSYLGAIIDQEPLGVPPNTNAGRTSKLTGVDTKAAGMLAEAVARGSASYRMETQIIIRIYDETIEKSDLAGSGTVPVTAK